MHLCFSSEIPDIIVRGLYSSLSWRSIACKKEHKNYIHHVLQKHF